MNIFLIYYYFHNNTLEVKWHLVVKANKNKNSMNDRAVNKK